MPRKKAASYRLKVSIPPPNGRAHPKAVLEMVRDDDVPARTRWVFATREGKVEQQPQRDAEDDMGHAVGEWRAPARARNRGLLGDVR